MSGITLPGSQEFLRINYYNSPLVVAVIGSRNTRTTAFRSWDRIDGAPGMSHMYYVSHQVQHLGYVVVAHQLRLLNQTIYQSC